MKQLNQHDGGRLRSSVDMTGWPIHGWAKIEMRSLLIAVAVILSVTGCSRGPSFDQEGSLDLTYERVHGRGQTTDSLHITTDFDFPEGLSWKPGQVASWVYRVHPQAKKEFMHQFAKALAKHRVDLIGKQSTNAVDITYRRLRIRGSGLDIDALIYELRDPKNPEAIWDDRSLTAMRGLIADVRLMAEICAIELPERLWDTQEEPNQSPNPTSAAGPRG